MSQWIPEVIVNITQEDGLLLFTQLPGSLGFSYLKPIATHSFEVIYRAGLACSVYGLGQNRERVFFDPPSSNGKSPGLKFGPFIFKRTLHTAKSDLKRRTSNLNLSPSGLLWRNNGVVSFIHRVWIYLFDWEIFYMKTGIIKNHTLLGTYPEERDASQFLNSYQAT